MHRAEPAVPDVGDVATIHDLTRGNTGLPTQLTWGQRMHQWIKQVSFLKAKPKLLRINTVKRNKRNSNTSFPKASWLYIFALLGFVCLANNYIETQISFISIQWEVSINIWVKISSLWLKFSNGVKCITWALCHVFYLIPYKKPLREKYIFQTLHDIREHNSLTSTRMYFPIQIFKNIILMSDRKVTYCAFLRGEIKNLYLIAVFYISSLGNTQ